MGTSLDDGEERSAKLGNVTIGAIAGEEARQGTEHEHSLSLSEAFKLYPSAIGWTIYFSLGVSDRSGFWSRDCRWASELADVGLLAGYHDEVRLVSLLFSPLVVKRRSGISKAQFG